jgi:hypothetical protein
MTSRRYLTVFYAVVAGIAAVGGGQVAHGWLHWYPVFAFAAVAAVEAGGAVISKHALDRRKLGERAIVARALSAAVAAGAVCVQWFGHDQVGPAAFFAGMSLLGYAVWLLDSEARRRDQLRAQGRLAATVPPFGVWQWLRHPAVTGLARRLARQDPALGWHRALEDAAAQLRRERREAAIAAVLHRKIRAAVDPTTADIAIATYDLDEIAARLAAGADYDGLTELLAVDLRPARLAPAEMVPAELEAELPELEGNSPGQAEPEVEAEPDGSSPGGSSSPVAPRRSAGHTKRLALDLLEQEPTILQKDLAAALGVTPRYVRELLAGRDDDQPAGLPSSFDDLVAHLEAIDDPRERGRAAALALTTPGENKDSITRHSGDAPAVNGRKPHA